MLGVEFRSNEHLARLSTPILILHSEDDDKVPVDLARKLDKDLPNSEIKIFDGYGHSYLYKAETLPPIILAFTS